MKRAPPPPRPGAHGQGSREHSGHEHSNEHAVHAHGAHHGGHEHGGHDHHDHAAATSGWAFVIGIAVNLAFVIAEAIYGAVAHSMALSADAVHNLGDVLGLCLAGGAAVLAKRRPSKRRTYGLRGTTMLASLANAVLLLTVTGAVVWESLGRLSHPGEVNGKTVVVVALVGVAINGASALLFMRGRHGDLNVRSAFVHLAGDAVLALGVAISGAIVLRTGLLWLDPAVSIALSVVILISTWGLLRRALDLVLGAVPTGIDPDAVRAFLERLPDVVEVHDLHIWAMSTTETALTAHVVMPGRCEPRFLGDVCRRLHLEFGVGHSTIQVDAVDAPDPCALSPEDVI
jgi:cobalt-zinc-cadmium efflux system protein